MSTRADRLRRLLAIRRLQEDLDRGFVRTAMAAVADARGALAATDDALKEAKKFGRTALNHGQHHDWLLADAQHEMAGWRKANQRLKLAERNEDAGVAMKKFLDSSREHEQIKRLVENADQASRTEEVRDAQIAADEWFLSRYIAD